MFERMQPLVERALTCGASYADARVERTLREELAVRNGRLAGARSSEELGLSLRVLVGGAWGFAARPLSSDGAIAGADELVARAISLARSVAHLRRAPVALAPDAPFRGEHATAVAIDPFAVPLADKLALLAGADRALGGRDEVVVRESSCESRRRELWLLSSDGARAHQTLTRCGGGIAATAACNGQVEKRSWPASFGGQFAGGGFERLRELELEAHAPRVRDEAIALCSAQPLEGGARDLVLCGNLLMLVIHESAGHASELDRALGCELDLAGDTFLAPGAANRTLFGSELVTLTADSTVPGGLDTRACDDDGVASQRYDVVRAGRFASYQSSRESATRLGERASRGANRAQSWYHPPIVRITNLSLEPGSWDLEDLIADTERGVLCDAVKTWSIDQRRWNFQFSAELGWTIENGKRARLVRGPSFQGKTAEFWSSCDAVCDARHWRLWGITNCGKGNPVQEVEMSHGAAPARFRGVQFVAT